MAKTLEAVLAAAQHLLAEGAAEPASAWRTLTLATVDAAGRPRQRSVVPRAFTQARCLEFHTDSRSAKHAELRCDARAALHGWDPVRRIQLRVQGAVTLHVRDEVASAVWQALPESTRGTYCVAPGPGTAIETPSDTRRTDDAAGFAVFCVVQLWLDELEWLHLEQGSYARARFCWDNGRRTSTWLVP